MDLRERRTALGWSRQDLAIRAHVDKAMLQLLELGQSEDHESRERCERAILEAEAALTREPGEA